MIIIAKTIKDIDKLINKAEYFLDKSIEYKTIYPSLSETYYKTHSELLNTVNNLQQYVRKAHSFRCGMDSTKYKDNMYVDIENIHKNLSSIGI